MFKLVTNRISTKTKIPTFSDFVKAAHTKAAMEKTASSGQPVTTAAKKAPVPAQPTKSVGKGTKKPTTQTVRTKKAEVVEFALKIAQPEEPVVLIELDKSGNPVAIKMASEDSAEGESSGQLDEDKNPQNDPYKDPKLKDGKKVSCDGDSDEGESSGQLDPEKNPQNDPKVDKEAVNKAYYKVANLSEAQKSIMRNTLRKFWPEKFVNALLADK